MKNIKYVISLAKCWYRSKFNFIKMIPGFWFLYGRPIYFYSLSLLKPNLKHAIVFTNFYNSCKHSKLLNMWLIKISLLTYFYKSNVLCIWKYVLSLSASWPRHQPPVEEAVETTKTPVVNIDWYATMSTEPLSAGV